MTKTSTKSSLASTNYDSTYSIFDQSTNHQSNGLTQSKLINSPNQSVAVTKTISSTHSSPIVRSVSSMASSSAATARKPRVLVMTKKANNKSMASSSEFSFRTAPTSPVVSTPRSADDNEDDCFNKNGFR